MFLTLPLLLMLIVDDAYSLSSTHIPIRYETEALLVCDKPEGIAHHDKTGGIESDSPITSGVLSLLRQEYPRLQDQLYGVHRLDQVTSGLLVIAKQPAMARCLTQAFTDRHVVKYYTGLSARAPKKKKQGWVNGYLRRGRRKSWYLTKETPDKERGDSLWAKTYFWTAGLGQLAEAYRGPGDYEGQNTLNDDPRTLILFRPYTGRTHQLRVVSKSLGLPLLGDPLYTTTASTQDRGPQFPRTCLHATGLHIPAEHLNEGGMLEDLTLWSPPPFLEWWQPQIRPDILRLLKKDSAIPPSLLDKACSSLTT